MTIQEAVSKGLAVYALTVVQYGMWLPPGWWHHPASDTYFSPLVKPTDIEEWREQPTDHV